MSSHNIKPFYDIYHAKGLALKKCCSCKGNVNIEYYPGYGVRLSCFNGCQYKVFYSKDYANDEEMAVAAVNEWNRMNEVRKQWN